jgi:hypothetical protein
LLAAPESAEVSFQTVSVIHGKPIRLDGLAERLRAAITGIEAEQLADRSRLSRAARTPAGNGGQIA